MKAVRLCIKHVLKGWRSSADEHLTEKPDDIRSKIEKTRQHQIQQNRVAFLSIVDTVLTCARQNLPLRSHLDENAALLSESE